MDKILRKPKLCFETDARPSHVTFDDGKSRWHNFPWLHYSGAIWEYEEPGRIKVFIGDFHVVITGYNLDALYRAIASHTLTWVSANPKSAHINDLAVDTFATEIQFLKPQAIPPQGQTKLDLGLE